jgi:hypothetical protein
MELRHAVGLLGLLCRRTRAMYSSRDRGRGGSPSLLPRHAEWINAVDVQAQSLHAVSGPFNGLNGEKANAPSTPCTILGVGFERLL